MATISSLLLPFQKRPCAALAILVRVAWSASVPMAMVWIKLALVQKLGKIDTLFIVDAAHDKAAWFNFGPETDTRIRKMWSRPVDFSGSEKRAARRA